MNLDQISAWLLKKKLRGSTFFHKRLLKGRNLRIKTKHGILLSLSPYEYVDRFIIEHGYYESEVLDAVLKYLPENGVFWDVGANIGIHAVTAARLMPKAKVFCFEPNPLMAEQIRENSKLNRVGLKIIGNALGNSNEVKPLYLHPGNSGRGSVHNWDNNTNLKTIEIRMSKADDLCPSMAKAPHVVKIDVEGNEHEVLKGMSRVLGSKQIKAIIFEDSREDSPRKRFLKSKGFRLRQLERREPSHHNLENYLAEKIQ